MTDVDLISGLEGICDGFLGNPFHAILRLAVARLKELTIPPPPGSIAVRIAIAANGCGMDWSAMPLWLWDVSASEIDLACHDKEAWNWVRKNCPGPITHEAIVTAHIPPRISPEVAATVEAFDPEATI